MLQLTILTPKETIATAEVERIVVPGATGQATILPQHADYTTLLAAGTVIYGRGDDRKSIAIASGLAQIKGDKAILLVNV